MVIGESHWWYQKFPEIWKRWLTQSLDCVSERFANVWLDDELDYHAGLWSYATGPQPVEHQNQYEMYLKEELFEVLFGKLATMCTPITCYDLRNCYQMVVGNHFNTNRNRWNDFRITYYLKANSTHSQNLSLMSVSPPQKKTTLYQQILHLMGLHAIRNLRYWTQIPVLFVHLLAIQSPLNPPRKELPLRQNARTSFSCWTRS